MSLSAPLTPVSKGQLRCNQCRKACPIKDGNWHNRGSQQVFICKACERTQRQ